MKLNINRNLTLISKCKSLHLDISQTDGEPLLGLEAKELWRRFQKELAYGYVVAKHKLKENL